MRRVAILGSTGSIGRSALAVADAHRSEVEIVALAAGGNHERLAEQVTRYRPRAVAMADGPALERLLAALPQGARPAVTGAGAAALVEVATHPDVDLVLCASSGTAALEAVLAAIEAGKTIALANKEVLVMAGGLVMAAARRHGVAVLPVDSEHNAIHQCLHGRDHHEIKRLILTASGGPFREWASETLDRVTPREALSHPTWNMGRKITIDSATLMNKGLEVIEAHWLFGVDARQIDVLIHPQSIVHSLVEMRDGSVLAQLGVTDMRLPIQYALSYPARWERAVPALDLVGAGRLEFFAPDLDRFPSLALAYRALEAGGSHAVVLNAANEVAVDAFLSARLSFAGIPRLIERALDEHGRGPTLPPAHLDDVRAVDRWAREFSEEAVRGLQSMEQR